MSPTAYRDGAAMWRAVTDKAKSTSRATSIPSQELMRRFVYDRFLARVFADPHEPWVLKGGTAVLARVNDARHSKDVDLLRRLGDIDEALAALRRACALDLSDHFRFAIGPIQSGGGATQQPHVTGSRVQITAFCGVARRDSFGVDQVAGSLMTASPELRVAETPLQISGLVPPTLHLYPVVDHVADKLCATEAIYGSGNTSSRVRDLVDLVVFARTQKVLGEDLYVAIKAERAHRELPHKDQLIIPDPWRATYLPLARRTPRCSNHQNFDSACELVATFLEPAMTGEARTKVWEPAISEWLL
ncbi:nucleotidyl transferase AbiEii/AbiGii toxin family protein [Kineosporia sp. NBRC 101731]|uniref:nucleotidyl transferase AbiEii/AbiGii toxin family protein n=1 Tax=Kineosporia sp. NBRC 101731 TaxID=3032199 RepID=UPI0024A13972|nr:nucleotidyl transferase AbiEii/AbiGii toxin family protein [Kineosporia sp. NBRC 101731]GLY31537.1 hypothetical protein Kisp02_49020 [Kineosporia sp. NBRC 101731]